MIKSVCFGARRSQRFLFVGLVGFVSLVAGLQVRTMACERLLERLGEAQAGRFVVAAGRVAELERELGMSPDQLMMALVREVRSLARPPISNYFVGAVGKDLAGNLYLGVNLEFSGFPLNQTVHGEQFVISQMSIHGAKGIAAIALSAPPCGHCRQFLNEVKGGDQLQVLIPAERRAGGSRGRSRGQPSLIALTLPQLLPKAFGPRELGWTSQLLASEGWNLKAARDLSELEGTALEFAKRSYAPHSQAPSGVAIRVRDGRVFGGAYLETTAFNPSLSPLQVALTGFVPAGLAWSEIKEVVLVERANTSVSHEGITRALLESIAPIAKFRRIEVLWDRWEQ